VNVDLAAATTRGIAVATTPGKNANAVAELTLAFTIMLARRVPDAMRYVDAGGEFGKDNFEGVAWFGRELRGRTIGLIGYGRVGSRVAQMAYSLGMRVLVHDPYVDAALIQERGATAVSLDYLLAESDVVSLHVRATPENRRLLGRSAVEKMKPGCLLVNTARDVLVDEDAVYEGLTSGRLGGAAFDVLSPQERGHQHRLLRLPNVVVVPHIGGSTGETLDNGCRMAVAEIQRFDRGESLASVANRAALAATPPTR
jgi:D-3-phosphoglycerate dehydrogenase